MTANPANRPLRVAIIGAGLMGRWHACYATRNGAKVVAVVDRDAAAADRLRAGFPAAGVFADAAAMYRAAAPDVAHICTPSETHVELVGAALEQRVHVMVEKPLAASAEQTRRLLDIADAAGKILCPVFQFPFQDGFRSAREWLQAHGPPLRTDLTICSAGAERLGRAADEQLVLEILPHPISVLCVLAGTDVVDHSRWTVAGRTEGELFAYGRIGAMEASVCVSTHARPARCEARVLCANGSLHLDFFHGYGAVQRVRGGRTGKILLPLESGIALSMAATRNLLRRALARETAYPGLTALIAAFYAAARLKAPPPFSRALIETVAEWCDRVGNHRATPAVSLPADRN